MSSTSFRKEKLVSEGVAKKIAFAHWVLSVLLILFGVDLIQNPEKFDKMISEYTGTETSSKYGPWSNPTTQRDQIKNLCIGISVLVIGIVLGFLNIALAVGINSRIAKVITMWLWVNITLMILYTLFSIGSILVLYNKQWIHVGELLLYCVNWILIAFVAVCRCEILELKEKYKNPDDTSRMDESQL